MGFRASMLVVGLIILILSTNALVENIKRHIEVTLPKVLVKVLRGWQIFLKVIFTIIFGGISSPFYILGGNFALYIIKKFPKSVYSTTYYISTIILFTSGAFITHKGSFEAFSKKNKENYMIVFNHWSFIDYLIATHILGKKPYKVVVGTNLKKYPIFCHFLNHVAILLERDNPVSEHKTYKEMIKALEDGFNVGVFPTAGRNRKHEMRDFTNGAFRAARYVGKDIITIGLYTADYCPAGPRSKNQTGELPNKLIDKIKYRLSAIRSIARNIKEYGPDHTLISPRKITVTVYPILSHSYVNREGELVKFSTKELSDKSKELMYSELPKKEVF